jgi:hypothetical protein
MEQMRLDMSRERQLFEGQRQQTLSTLEELKQQQQKQLLDEREEIEQLRSDIVGREQRLSIEQQHWREGSNYHIYVTIHTVGREEAFAG